MKKEEIRDNLLALLVLLATSALLAALVKFRRDGLLFWGLLIFAAPSVAAFILGVPFVPVPAGAARKMLEAAGLKPGETVYDLGCGDGRIVHLAAREYGAKGVGVELSPIMYLLAKARGALRGPSAEIRLGDFRNQDLSKADVVCCYLNSKTMAALRDKFLRELKPGARVVSCVYRIPDWEETRSEFFEGLNILVYKK
ncbi:MAG: SAM-dependent methyltransferase [Elusimicrobiales bacterium]